MKTENQPQHMQGELKAYPEALKHSEVYPISKPYRVDIAIDGFAQHDGAGLIAKVYGKTQQEAEANAQRIVKAVNMHDELVNALKYFVEISRSTNFPTKDREMAEKLLKQAQ